MLRLSIDLIFFLIALAVEVSVLSLFMKENSALFPYISDWLSMGGLWLLPRVALVLTAYSFTSYLMEKYKGNTSLLREILTGAAFGLSLNIWLFLGEMALEYWLTDVPIFLFFPFIFCACIKKIARLSAQGNSLVPWLALMTVSASAILALRFPPDGLYHSFFGHEDISVEWILYANASHEAKKAMASGEPYVVCVTRLYLICPGWQGDLQEGVPGVSIPGTGLPMSGLANWLVSRTLDYAEDYNSRLQRLCCTDVLRKNSVSTLRCPVCATAVLRKNSVSTVLSKVSTYGPSTNLAVSRQLVADFASLGRRNGLRSLRNSLPIPR